MTIKTRLNKIEHNVNTIIGGDRIPPQLIYANTDEELEQKLNELKRVYGEEKYNKSLIIIRPPESKAGFHVLL